MTKLKEGSMAVAKGACNILSSLLPKQLYDIVREHPLLSQVDMAAKVLRTDQQITNFIYMAKLNKYDFKKIASTLVEHFDKNGKVIVSELPLEVAHYYMTAKKILKQVYEIAGLEGFKDADLINIIKAGGQDYDTFMAGILTGNHFMIVKGLLGSGKKGSIVNEYVNMFDDLNGLFGKRLQGLRKTDPDNFVELRDYFSIYGKKVGPIKSFLMNMLSSARLAYRFIAYTLHPINGIVLGLVQTLAYGNMKSPIRGKNLKKIRDIHRSLGILPSKTTLNMNQFFADIHTFDGNGWTLEKLFDNMFSFLNKYPKLKEYVMQSTGGLHQIVDLMFDEYIKTLSFYRAIKRLGFKDEDEFLKYYNKIKNTEEGRQFLKTVNEESINVYEEMKGFPINYGTNKVIGGFWKPFFAVEGFMSSWGLNVMKKGIEHMFKPISDAVKVYGETGDIKLARKVFMQGLNSEEFLYAMSTMFQSGLMGARVYRGLDDEDNKPKNTREMIERGLNMATAFNQVLQSFQSNIVGRMYLEGYKGLTYEDGYDTNYAVYRMLDTLGRNFLKELKVTDPFVTAIKTYNDAIKGGANSDDAFDLAMTSMFKAFNDTFNGYVRYLEPTQSKFDDMYWQKTTPLDGLSYILGENVNPYKQDYYDLRNYESYLKMFKEGSYKNTLNYFLWNLPLFRALAKNDYSQYFGKTKLIIDELVKDDNIWEIRTKGIIPVDLKNVDDATQEKWVNYLYQELTKFAPQKYKNVSSINEPIIFADNEMKRLFKNVRDKVLQSEENIWVKDMVDTLMSKGAYDAYLKLYHSKDGQAGENYFKGMVQILGMLDAQSPGASRKFLSMYAYDLLSEKAKNEYGKYYTQLNPIEKYNLQKEVLGALLPFMNYTNKGYVDYTFQVNALGKYLELTKPELLAKARNGSTYLPDSLKKYLALDLYTEHQLLSGDIDAYKIKNIRTKIGQSLDNDDLKIMMINKTLETIDKHDVPQSEKNKVTTGILLANLDILDKIINDKEFSAKYGKVADALVHRLWHNNQQLIVEGEEYTKGKIVDELMGSTGIKGKNPYANSSYSRYRSLYNNLRNYAQKQYPRIFNRGVANSRYPGVYGGGSSRITRPYYSRYQPYYNRGYSYFNRQQPNYPAKSRTLINEKKQPVKRNFSVRTGRIKPIKVKE